MHRRLFGKNINWPLLAWHVLAIPFLILGAQQLQAIRWLAMAQVYEQRGSTGLQQHYPTLDIGGWVSEMWLGPLYAWALAVSLGCLLSASIVWQRRQSRLIPLLVLGLSVVSSWTHYYESVAVKSLLVWVRWPLEALPAESRLGFAGGLLILTGLLIFLFSWRKVPTAH
jgi:hypothetical protein